MRAKRTTSSHERLPHSSNGGFCASHSLGHRLRRTCVLDVEPPSFAKIGDWVEGDIFVGIDPFFYKEYLHKLPGMPNLYYNWKVEGVLRQDTPWFSAVNEQARVTLSRDAARERWTDVQHTKAWDDDDGRESDVLRCGRQV